MLYFLGKKEGQFLKLILDVRTRWNSTYYMIERFLKLTNNLSQMLLIFNGNDIPESPEMISGHDIRCLQDICSLFRPFEVLTREISTEKSVMSSKIIPIILGTRNELMKKIPNAAVSIRLKSKLIEELDYGCGAYKQTSILPICTLLDSRICILKIYLRILRPKKK